MVTTRTTSASTPENKAFSVVSSPWKSPFFTQLRALQFGWSIILLACARTPLKPCFYLALLLRVTGLQLVVRASLHRSRAVVASAEMGTDPFELHNIMQGQETDLPKTWTFVR